MSQENVEIVRRTAELINSSESVDEAMAAFEPMMDPEIEWVNPEDAIERGTRRGAAGMRTVMENFIGGAGGGASAELEEILEREDRVFIRIRLHARGELSGAEAIGPPVGMIFTIRAGRVARIEWHFDLDGAVAAFEQGK